MGIICSQRCSHPKYGYLNIKVISTAKRVTARLRGDIIYITTPPIEFDRFLEILDRLAANLIEKKQNYQRKYFIGYRFEAEDWFLTIEEQSLLPSGSYKWEHKGISADGRHEYKLYAYVGADFSALSVESSISKIIMAIAKNYMAIKVIDYAKDIANDLGLNDRVNGWKIGTGQRRLGTCSSKGIITLSAALAFMPIRLRRHTITHELAHLSHFDHSPAFHAEWNRLFGEDAAKASSEFKAVKYPVI